MQPLDLTDLQLLQSSLRRELPSCFDAHERGAIHLELGALARLLDGFAGIPCASSHLRAALALLPEEAAAQRRRACSLLELPSEDGLEQSPGSAPATSVPLGAASELAGLCSWLELETPRGS